MHKIKNGIGLVAAIGFGVSFLAVAQAEDTTDYSPQGMQQLSIELNKMRNCMSDVDEIAQQKFEAQTTELDQRLRELCAANQSAKAQALALSFSKEMQNSAIFLQIENCTRPMRTLGFMPPLPVVKVNGEGQSQESVCSHYPSK
ncbi:MAG: hypothetical protein JXR44_06890 [Thiotrichales bacterium]|nr:hypothetical protein [Thiotrichales bacterium]